MDIQILETIKPEGVLWRDYNRDVGTLAPVTGVADPADPLDYTGLTAKQIQSKKMQIGKARKKVGLQSPDMCNNQVS